MSWKEKLEAEQRENALDTEGASIDEVAVEKIWIGFGGKPILLEDVHEIEKLTVDISTHRKLSIIRYFNVNQRGLFT